LSKSEEKDGDAIRALLDILKLSFEVVEMRTGVGRVELFKKMPEIVTVGGCSDLRQDRLSHR
jgi:hypothetical protein